MTSRNPRRASSASRTRTSVVPSPVPCRSGSTAIWKSLPVSVPSGWKRTQPTTRPASSATRWRLSASKGKATASGAKPRGFRSTRQRRSSSCAYSGASRPMKRNVSRLIAGSRNTGADGQGRRPTRSDVELLALDLARPLHDELEPRRDVLAEKVVDHPVGLELVHDAHPERLPAPRVQGRGLEIRGRHLSQTLEPGDVRLRVPLGLLLEDAVAVTLVDGPVGLLADVDPVERRLGDVDDAVLDERTEVPVEERQQQGGDVVPVAVGVHQEE